MKTAAQKIKHLAALDGWVLAKTQDRRGNQFYRRIDDPDENKSDSAWRRAGEFPAGFQPLPDYLKSYDGILPLIQKQTQEIRRKIAINLWGILGIDSDLSEEEAWARNFLTTPAQLADALLLATGDLIAHEYYQQTKPKTKG